MPLTFANPYTPATPIGAGLQNIATALFAGRNAKNDASDAAHMAQAENFGAHSDLYREQTKKTAAERAIAESLLGARSPDSQDFLRSSESGLPMHTLRGIDAALKGQAPLDQYSPEELAAHRRATISISPAYADKTTSALDIAHALNLNRTVDDRNAVISGKQDPTRTAQGYFSTSGKAPFDNLGDAGTFNQNTGDQSLNELGSARSIAQRALGKERSAKADRGGPLRLKPVIDENGDTIYVPDNEAIGRPVGSSAGNKPRATRKITGTDKALMDNALGGLLSEMNVKALDDQTRNAVLLQAEKEWQDGAEGHGNAVKAALDKVAPGGLETPWQLRSFLPGFDSKSQPKGGMQPTAGQAPKPAKVASGLPDAARAKLREGVVTTFGNGSKWTLSDGVPAQVR